MSNRDTRGTARSRPGARPAPVVSPTRRSERVAERVVSPSPPRGRARVDTPAPPPPRHSRAQEPEESDAPRGWLPLVPRYGSPRAALLFFTALLATAAQALCLLPVAWPRDSPMRWLCQGPWAARLHPASALSLFNAWLLFRELHRPGRAVAMLFAHIALGSLAGGPYVLWALRAARGDWARFWLGDRATRVAVIEAPHPDSPEPDVTATALRRGRSRKRSE